MKSARFLISGLLLTVVVASASTGDPPPSIFPPAPSKASRGTDRKPLVPRGWVKLTGKVKLTGDLPAARKGWKIGPERGVADVVVWLRAPAKQYLEVPPQLRKTDDTLVTLDQPDDDYVPHVLVLFPSYYDADAKKQMPTGQHFAIRNSSAGARNFHMDVGDPNVNSGQNRMLLPGQGPSLVELAPCRMRQAGGEQFVKCASNLNRSASAYVWVFDHPAQAVSVGDNKDRKAFGSYEIANAPAGVPVDLMYWHESFGHPSFGGTGPRKLKTVTLKSGDNHVDITLRAP
jgi:hypothetical protein